MPIDVSLFELRSVIQERLPVDEIPTPALLLDETIVRRNIDRLVQYGDSHHISIRPHTKTHKNKFLAQLQLDAGCQGLTVAKVGEAEVMADVCDDLLLAYPAVDAARTDRIARLAERITIRVAVDNALALEQLERSAAETGTFVGILVDIDVGLGRTGVSTIEESLDLARVAANSRHLRLDGIMVYPGHVWSASENQGQPLSLVSDKLAQVIDLWRREGLEAGIVSGGSTPTAYQSHLVPQLTEIRPGTYIFNDLNELRAGYCTQADCAATIVATVVSNAVKNQVVLDCGSKTLTSDLCGPARDSGHGMIVEYPDAKIVKLSEEHAQVDISRCGAAPRLGQRVRVIPNHICPCVNLMNSVWWVDAQGYATPLRIDSRGLLS